MITAAVIILASASWIGAALFQLPAKDSLSTYTGPVISLSLGITLVGAFLSHRLTISSTARHKHSLVKALEQPSDPRQFTHELVPGGKDAEDFHSRTIPEAQTVPSTVFKPLYPATADTTVKPEQHYFTTRKWASPTSAPTLSGPPDQLEPRIDAFSFNCQECKGTINLPWEKIRKAMGNDQLQVDCPHCHRQYPFDYERAERKTLSITFHGILRPDENAGETVSVPSIMEASATFEDKETQVERQPESPTRVPSISAVEPVQAIADTAPIDLSSKSRFAGLSENRVGEAARAIRDSSKVLVGSFANNRLFQTMAARLQPGTSGTSWTLGSGSSGNKFTHVLVPGGKEGDSLSQVIPAISGKPTLVASVDFDASHRTFEDMPSPNEPAEKPIERQALTGGEVSALAPPDRLSVHIDAFSFNCQDCEGAVSLPWAKVEAGPATPQFQVDCPSCHQQYPFNYEQTKRKTLRLTFKPLVENPVAVETQADVENKVEASKSPDSEPKPIQEAKLVQEPKPVQQEAKSAQQEPIPVQLELKEKKRTSPGMEYDKAILEKG